MTVTSNSMIRSTSRIRVCCTIAAVLALVLGNAGALPSQSRSDFAEHLMREHDYYRAISLYKELEYFAGDVDSAAWYAYRICAAYRYSRHFEHALSQGADLLGRASLNGDLERRTKMHLGLSHIQLDAPQIGISWLQEAAHGDTSALPDLFLALAFTDLNEYSAARLHATRVLEHGSTTRYGVLARRLDEPLATADDIPSRNPLLMAASSAVIPGIGQAMCGHYVDALQAFTYVAAFAFTALIANRYEVQQGPGRPLTTVALSVTGIFHLANILGAHHTAAYFNQRQKDLRFEEVREDILRVEF
jgi:hypothetical protein